MVKKALHYVILMMAILVLNFALPRMMPGSPMSRHVDEGVGQLTPEQRERIISAYNLDRPIAEQFIIYIRDIFTFNLGMSFSKNQPIAELLKTALPWTVLLALCNLILSTLIGTFLGALSAFRRKKRKDFPLILIMTALGSFPAFWIGMVLISVFGVRLRLLPIFGAFSMWGGASNPIWDITRHLIMPTATLVLVTVGIFFSTARFSVLSVLEQDYIKMAQARGLSQFRIHTHYIIRNSLIPVFTLLMMEAGFIFSGALVIEKLFSYPGIGLLLYDAVMARDYPLMQYTFLLTSFAVIAAAFLADLMNGIIDPTMRNAYEQ